MEEILKTAGIDNLPGVSLDIIEKKLLQLPQAECPLFHYFGDGLYIREVHFPAGAMVLGHRQKFSHVNIFIQGKVLMLNPDGSKTELSAPMTFIGPPGRKVGYILEDVIWQNVYATDETDIDKLEAWFLDKTDYAVEYHKDTTDYSEDHADYELVVQECGMVPEQIKEEVENEEDQIPMPNGWTKVCVRDSALHGKGLFASAPFYEGEVIAPANINGKRTPAGRYTNHSCRPNAKVFQVNNDIVFVALRNIEGCRAGDRGEEITIDYRQTLQLRGLLEVEECQAQ
jgi:hypothetical protein